MKDSSSTNGESSPSIVGVTYLLGGLADYQWSLSYTWVWLNILGPPEKWVPIYVFDDYIHIIATALGQVVPQPIPLPSPRLVVLHLLSTLPETEVTPGVAPGTWTWPGTTWKRWTSEAGNVARPRPRRDGSSAPGPARWAHHCVTLVAWAAKMVWYPGHPIAMLWRFSDNYSSLIPYFGYPNKLPVFMSKMQIVEW